MVGSIAYIVGSAGYLPAINEFDAARLGDYAFIIGSVWLVASLT